MSGIGTGYDLSVSTFSPDGRVFQTDYAQKAIDNSGTVVGIKCKDGVVLGVEKTIVSKMLEKGSNKRTFPVDRHAGMAVAGVIADGRQVVNRAFDEAVQYKSFYGDSIPGQVLADRVASFVHVFNLYWYASLAFQKNFDHSRGVRDRPFGTSVLLAAYDDSGPQLYVVEPSGNCHRFFGTAVGKGRQAAKTEIERLKLGEISCEQGVVEVAKILYSVHDEEKPFELEISWICDASDREFRRVPDAILEAAEQQAKASLEESDMED